MARTNSRELFTLAAIALALGVAYGAAELFGMSVALGAFFAGMVISGSDHSHRAASYLQPFQDTFAALFFVAVGMLFEPRVLLDHPWEVLLVLGIIVIGKALAACALVLLLRRPLATALSVAASPGADRRVLLHPRGDGRDMGLLPPQGQSYIVAGALLSITINPLVFTLLPPDARGAAAPEVLRAAATGRAPPRAHPRAAAARDRCRRPRRTPAPPAGRRR